MPSALFYFLSVVLAYVGAIALLMALSLRVPRAGYAARMMASMACLIVAASYGVVVSVLLRLVGLGGLSQWATARFFQLLMRFSTGVVFEVEGGEHLKNRPAVFVANHQSELDVLMLGAVFPPYCSVTAKKSLKYVPFLGWFMALSNTVFIDRGNRHDAMAAFERAAAEMRRHKASINASVFIFPEGTRSYSAQPDLLPFKKGAFHLAVQAKVPIVPVVVANYSNVLHLQSKRFEAGRIAVRVLPPMPTAHMTPADVEDVTRDTRERMLAELVQLTQKARANGVATPATEKWGDQPVTASASGADYGRADPSRQGVSAAP
ncbi:MAG: 1-acylglycerol-3-phosphate O-acyltransferase [Thelocarpon impressellum]|nr:MAG: 1-acylglycerol-3-phosphate O-acyltransferase [Thelocarpon impressellum]